MGIINRGPKGSWSGSGIQGNPKDVFNRWWTPINDMHAMHETNLPHIHYRTLVDLTRRLNVVTVIRAGHKPHVQRRILENCVAKPMWAEPFTCNPLTGLLDIKTMKPKKQDWDMDKRRKVVYTNDAGVVEKVKGKFCPVRRIDQAEFVGAPLAHEAYEGLIVDWPSGMPITSDTDIGSIVPRDGTRSAINIYSTTPWDSGFTNSREEHWRNSMNQGFTSLRVFNAWTGKFENGQERMPHGPNIFNPYAECEDQGLPNAGSERLITIVGQIPLLCKATRENQVEAYESLMQLFAPTQQMETPATVTQLYDANGNRVWSPRSS